MKCLWKLNISRWMLKARMFYSEEEAMGRSAGIKVDKERKLQGHAGSETVNKRSPHPSTSNSPGRPVL